MTGRLLGILVAGLASFLSTYEFVALLTPLPTISRIVQGLRDSGPVGKAIVYGLAAASLAALTGFGRWVYKHFRSDRRSTL